jgi:hypothetical protein
MEWSSTEPPYPLLCWSVQRTTSEAVPALPVGVPEMTPVDELRVSPAGRPPPTIWYRNGPQPPERPIVKL